MTILSEREAAEREAAASFAGVAPKNRLKKMSEANTIEGFAQLKHFFLDVLAAYVEKKMSEANTIEGFAQLKHFFSTQGTNKK